MAKFNMAQFRSQMNKIQRESRRVQQQLKNSVNNYNRAVRQYNSNVRNYRNKIQRELNRLNSNCSIKSHYYISTKLLDETSEFKIFFIKTFNIFIIKQLIKYLTLITF